MTYVTVTGHRPDRLGGYGEGTRVRVESFANNMLRVVGATQVRIGGALGWDQACGWACVRRGIPFDILEPGMVPTTGDYSSRWPQAARDRYDKLRSNAASVTQLPWAGAGREFTQRDWRLLDEPCELVLALWCGEPSGTGTTVRMAEQRGRIVWNCWDEWRTWL